MDITPYYGTIVVIAMAIYMAVGYYYKGLKQGESFSIEKALETVVLVVLLTVTGLMSGVTVTAEWISTLLGTFGQNPVTLTAIMAALLGIIDQFVKTGGRIITGGAVQAAETEQAKASLPGVFEPSPSQPAGKAAILGIYGHSASGGVPAATATFDVNQVPELFFDMQTLVTGKILLAIKIDGAQLKDWAEEGASLTKVGEKLPRAFWIPQKYRTVGTHIISISMGHLAGADTPTTDSKAVWDNSQDFGLVFTGTKASE